MQTNDSDHGASIRYQPDEKPPLALTIGLGLQLAILCIAGVVLTPAIVIRAAGGSEAFLSWAVFAAVAVSGVTTVLQAVRVGRFGAGHVLLMGTSGAFIAVCVTALVQGGPAMLATLVWCLTNTVTNLRVLLAVGCVALPRVVTATARPERSEAESKDALPTTKMPSHLHNRICETPH